MEILGAKEWLSPTDRMPAPTPQMLVRMTGVNYAFARSGARTQVLFDIGLEIATGQLVVLSGPSGAGKTKLLL